jgi:hypothetical protein
LRVDEIRGNPYRFISKRARDACDKYGVKSVSLVAVKEGGTPPADQQARGLVL